MVKAVGEYLKGASEVPSNRMLVMVGAQSPAGPDGRVASDTAAQCAVVWSKISEALAQKNLGTRHIVAVEIDLADRENLDVVLTEQARHVRHHVAQTVRIVGLLDPEWKAQVAVVAAVTR
jgi:enamine deaminase RidA (YjgF/YER057c/UK114 family)